MVQERHPRNDPRGELEAPVATSISSVQQCQRRLAGVGFELPTWDRLVEGQRPNASDENEASWGGWQQRPSEKLERDHFSTPADPHRVRAGDEAQRQIERIAGERGRERETSSENSRNLEKERKEGKKERRREGTERKTERKRERERESNKERT